MTKKERQKRIYDNLCLHNQGKIKEIVDDKVDNLKFSISKLEIFKKDCPDFIFLQTLDFSNDYATKLQSEAGIVEKKHKKFQICPENGEIVFDVPREIED